MYDPKGPLKSINIVNLADIFYTSLLMVVSVLAYITTPFLVNRKCSYQGVYSLHNRTLMATSSISSVFINLFCQHCKIQFVTQAVNNELELK